MLKDITFGQYVEADSIIHKLDPRIKILLLIAYIVFIFIVNNLFSIAFASVFILAVTILSKVPVKLFAKNIKAILPIIIFTAILNALYVGQGALVIHFWVINIYEGGIYRAVFMSLRIILLIIISALLTYTSTPTALTDAIESLLSPLQYIGLKNAVHIMALMMTIALRFIPTLIEETDKIMSSQKARGASLDSGSFKQKVKALLPVLIPLLSASIRRAYELADAMESRCYNGGEGRVRMKQMTLTLKDYIAIIVSVVFFAALIILNTFAV